MRRAATRLMNLRLESMIFISFFFNERAAAAGVFPLHFKRLFSRINERLLLQTEGRARRLSRYISHFTVNNARGLNWALSSLSPDARGDQSATPC